jgi:hypothetical protein
VEKDDLGGFCFWDTIGNRVSAKYVGTMKCRFPHFFHVRRDIDLEKSGGNKPRDFKSRCEESLDEIASIDGDLLAG